MSCIILFASLNNEKETLDEDINLDEISKVIKILKPNKSPGEDGIISELFI
jgi:hypothetical protein